MSFISVKWQQYKNLSDFNHLTPKQRRCSKICTLIKKQRAILWNRQVNISSNIVEWNNNFFSTVWLPLLFLVTLLCKALADFLESHLSNVCDSLHTTPNLQRQRPSFYLHFVLDLNKTRFIQKTRLIFKVCIIWKLLNMKVWNVHLSNKNKKLVLTRSFSRFSVLTKYVHNRTLTTLSTLTTIVI